MTVEIRRAGGEWLIEVKGEAIGRADSAREARALAEYWARRLECVAILRPNQPQVSQKLPDALGRLVRSE